MNCRHFGVLDASSIAGIPQTHFSVKKKKQRNKKVYHSIPESCFNFVL